MDGKPRYKWVASSEIVPGNMVEFAGVSCKVTHVEPNPATKKIHITVEQETYHGVPETTYIVEAWQELPVVQQVTE